MKKILMMVLMLVSAAFCQASMTENAFNSDLNKAASDIKTSKSQVPPVTKANYIKSRYYDTQCTDFNFGVNDGALSPLQQLISTERITECWMEYYTEEVCITLYRTEYRIQYYNCGKPKLCSRQVAEEVPYQQCWPEQRQRENCANKIGNSVQRKVQLSLSGNRALFPWETEKFQACLTEDKMVFSIKSTPYNYTSSQSGNLNVLYSLTAGNRILAAPEPESLYLTSLERVQNNDEDRIVMQVKDAWPNYFAGSKVAIHARLMLARPRGIPDIVTTDLVYDFDVSAEPYSIDWNAKELYLNLDSETYYVIWEFKRVGSQATTEDYVEKGETNRVGKN